MFVTMMYVGEMPVGMRQALMRVGMRMRLPFWIIRAVRMLMVCVMDVRMGVLQRFVDVLVLVSLSEMQKETCSHADCRDHEQRRYMFAPD